MKRLIFMTAPLMIAFFMVPVVFKGAVARVIVKEHTKYYAVEGRNGAQLFRSIKRVNSKALNGKIKGRRHSIAHTNIKVNIDAKHIQTVGGGCKLSHANVILNLQYTYPDWKQNKKSSKRMRNLWERFMNHVTMHEMQHGHIARSYAKALDRVLSKEIGVIVKDCHAQKMRLKRAFHSIKKKYMNMHAIFDQKEGRGKAPIRKAQKTLLASN